MATRKKTDDEDPLETRAHEQTWGASQAEKQEYDETVGEKVREAREDEEEDGNA